MPAASSHRSFQRLRTEADELRRPVPVRIARDDPDPVDDAGHELSARDVQHDRNRSRHQNAVANRPRVRAADALANPASALTEEDRPPTRGENAEEQVRLFVDLDRRPHRPTGAATACVQRGSKRAFLLQTGRPGVIVVLVAEAVTGSVLVASGRDLRPTGRRIGLVRGEDRRGRALGGAGGVSQASDRAERGKHAERERRRDCHAQRRGPPRGPRFANMDA